MDVELRNRMLLVELIAIDRIRMAVIGLRERARRAVQDENGQTPTEYLMIVGLMAAAIVTIFVTFFWGTIRAAASTWANQVRDAVLGNKMK
jgi:Flp pilus assembly pilin Flp